MNASTNGILGSVIIVAVIYVVYLVATKKTPWNLSGPIPDDWKKGKWPLALAVVVLLVLTVWLLPSLQSPTPGAVWEFFRSYWMWAILALAGLYFWFDGMTPAPAWSKGAKGMVVAFAVLVVGAIAVHGIWGGESSPQQMVAVCPPVSDKEVRRCVIGEKPTVFTTELLQYFRVLKFCVVKPSDGEYRSRQTSSKSWLIWSTKGPLPIEYKLLEGSCPDSFI